MSGSTGLLDTHDDFDPLRANLTGPDEVEPNAEALIPHLDGWSPYGPNRISWHQPDRVAS